MSSSKISIFLRQRRLGCCFFFFLLCFFCFCCERCRSQASAPKTDPIEALAVNTIMGRWGKTASQLWNISGELCSGIAMDSTNFGDFNPAIKCDCSYLNGTVCHVTQLARKHKRISEIRSYVENICKARRPRERADILARR